MQIKKQKDALVVSSGLYSYLAELELGSRPSLGGAEIKIQSVDAPISVPRKPVLRICEPTYRSVDRLEPDYIPRAGWQWLRRGSAIPLTSAAVVEWFLGSFLDFLRPSTPKPASSFELRFGLAK